MLIIVSLTAMWSFMGWNDNAKI